MTQFRQSWLRFNLGSTSSYWIKTKDMIKSYWSFKAVEGHGNDPLGGLDKYTLHILNIFLYYYPVTTLLASKSWLFLTNADGGLIQLVLYCIVLYCIVLCCVVLCCVVLCCVLFCASKAQGIVFYVVTAHYSALHCSVSLFFSIAV